MTDCVFCRAAKERTFLGNSLAVAIWDEFPVTPMHALIVPRRHAEDRFLLSSDEVAACDELIRLVREIVRQRDPSVDGFNIGENIGEVAGQTVFHSHIHLIPRRRGDVEYPRGGIRHIIPSGRLVQPSSMSGTLLKSGNPCSRSDRVARTIRPRTWDPRRIRAECNVALSSSTSGRAAVPTCWSPCAGASRSGSRPSR